MNKNMIKKIISVAIILISIVLLVSTFFTSDKVAIIGTWQEKVNYTSGVEGMEFYSDNTGMRYKLLADGSTYNEETFSYRLDKSKIIIDLGWKAKAVSYSISGEYLTYDGVEFKKTGGANIPWVRYVLIIICLVCVFLIYSTDRSIPEKNTADNELIHEKTIQKEEDITDIRCKPVEKVIVTTPDDKIHTPPADRIIKTIKERKEDDKITESDKFTPAGDL